MLAISWDTNVGVPYRLQNVQVEPQLLTPLMTQWSKVSELIIVVTLARWQTTTFSARGRTGLLTKFSHS